MNSEEKNNLNSNSLIESTEISESYDDGDESDTSNISNYAPTACAMLASMTQQSREVTHHSAIKPVQFDEDGKPTKEQVPQPTMDRILAYLEWANQKGIIDVKQKDTLIDYLPFQSWHRAIRTDSYTPSRSNSLSGQSAILEDVAKAMTDPRNGVRIGRRKKKWSFKHYHDVFVGKEAVDWMIHRQIANTRKMAVDIGRELVNRGYFAHVAGQHTFEDDEIFFRFTKHRPSFALALSPEVPALKSSLLRLVYHVHEDTVPDWLRDASPREIQMTYPAILMWLKTHPELRPQACKTLCKISATNPIVKIAVMGFMRANGENVDDFDVELDEDSKRTVDLGNLPHPASVARKYQKEKYSVMHPFVGEVADYVILKKEFTSNAKPAWVRFMDMDGTPMMPDIVAKYGDDLRKDLAVQLIFNAMEAIWAAAPVVWRLGKPPSVCTYQVLVTSDKGGMLEFVKGKTIKDVEIDKEWGDVDLVHFAPSAIGSYVSGFVLGVRDRHSENWMLVDKEEDPKLMQIDFGYMLLENPGGFPLDTPRLTMQPVLIKLMKKTTGVDGENSVMYDFQRDMVTAFGVLRRHMHALVSFSKVVLSNVYDPKKIETFMWGPHAFRAGEEESKALQHFEDKVRKSLTVKNFRRGAKHALVKGYYAVRKII